MITKETIQDIIEKYRSGELEDGTDEKGREGFWDLAGEIAGWNNSKDEYGIIEERQDDIYQAMKILFNLTKL